MQFIIIIFFFDYFTTKTIIYIDMVGTKGITLESTMGTRWAPKKAIPWRPSVSLWARKDTHEDPHGAVVLHDFSLDVTGVALAACQATYSSRLSCRFHWLAS